MKRWNKYLIQEGEPDPVGGPEGDPPSDPPKEGDPPKDPPKDTTIPLSVLPEDLRDRPEAEVKFLLEHMITSLGSRNNEVEELKDQIAEFRGAVSVQPPSDPDPDEEKSMEELMLENAEKAMDRWARKRGYVDEIGSLSGRVGEAEFSMVAAEVGDFADHEDRVRAILKDGKVPANRISILGAYKLALGEKVMEDRARDARANSGSIPPSPSDPPKPEEDAPKLSELETEIMHAHDITDPAVWAKHRDTPIEVKLPT